ncbi:MAG: hypothetical protein ACP5KK_03100, partial [Candidatus Nanoarchaeia archaeon]
MQRKGVSNIVLMGGIALCIAVLLIGGMALVIKLVEAEARSQPQFIATQLTNIITLIQTAPESATYQYYTPIDDLGFPVIGSLEIDDDERVLCISKKTEDEIANTIIAETGIAAGIGGAEYAYGKVRTEMARRVAQRVVAEEIAKKLNIRLYYGTYFPRLARIHSFLNVKVISKFSFMKRLSLMGKIKIYAGFFIGVAIASFALTWWLTGDIWQALQSVALTVIQLIIYTIFPKIITKVLVKYAPKYAERLARVFATNVGLSTADEGVSKIPIVGQPASLVLKAAQVIVNLVFTIWDVAERGYLMYQIWDAAGKAVAKEKGNIVCKSFNTKNPPLLHPPNLAPTVKFGDNFESD